VCSTSASEPRTLPPVGRIASQRVLLRPVEGADLDGLMAVNGDPAVTRFLPYETWQSQQDAMAWLARMQQLGASGTGQQLVVERNQDRRIIGTVLVFRYDAGSARAEIGYVLGRAHWRQGYMREALAVLVDHAFSALGLRRLEAEVNPENSASCRVLDTLGFVHEGTLRQRWVGNRGPYDTRLYGLLAHEWIAVPSRKEGT